MVNQVIRILEQSQIEQDIPPVIGMALLTILIPVAIAIFNNTNEFETLDRNVILGYVVKAKFLLLYLALIFLPLLFWNVSQAWLRFLELIFWTSGIFFMTQVLIKSYHWMKGNKFSSRFGYLRSLKNLKDMEESWYSVWHTETINPQNEREFFEIFSSTIDQLLRNHERKS